MDIETESIIALNKFKDSLNNSSEYGNDGCQFEGLITYSANGTTQTEILIVTLIIGGFEPMIKLDVEAKSRILTSKKYHLDFNPKFSNNTIFKFDSTNNSMIIIGENSPKLGNYEVIIIEAE